MNPENKPFQNFQGQQNQAQNQPQNQPQHPKKDENPFVFDKYVAIALVAGLIVGFLIGFGTNGAKDGGSIFGGNSTSTKEVKLGDEELGGTIQTSSADSEKIRVEDQEAGSYVKVANLELDATYWVAVRDSLDSTNIPYILGARKITAGSYTDVSIYVTRKTEDGKKYDVVLYKDSPDFNYQSSALVMNNGNIVRSTFDAK